MKLTDSTKMKIAEAIYDGDYGLAWSDLSEQGKEEFIMGYIDPTLEAIDKLGFNIVPKGMICHW